MDDWQEYLNRFEQKIMVPMFTNGLYNQKKVMVSLRPGKLAITPFGIFTQTIFESEEDISLNFYGLFKFSTALLKNNLNIAPKQVTVNAPVIHFNSIKIEHIERFDSELLKDFAKFKDFMVRLRWGN